MAPQAKQDATGVTEAVPPMVRPNILIVDDRKENLLATEKILRHLDAGIFKANSGNEALSLVLRHRFAVVLLDVQMPDMDGFETAMLMQEHESMRGVPIIFVTAISKEERYANQAAEIGAADYIFKPINSELLKSKVKVYLDLYVQREEMLKIQRALADAESRLRTILDNVLDGIITIDGSGTVISINPAVVKMFGYKAEDVVGRDIQMLMPEPNRSSHDGHPARYESTGSAGGIGVGRELEGLTKAGLTFPIELTVTEVSFHGQRMFVGLVRNITERKRAEDISRQARDAAEAANRTKSNFLANMSHEIRTPINAIMGMTYLAQRANPSPRQQGYLTKIGIASQSLLSIINDILDFSKIEAGKLGLEHITFSLNEVLRNLIDIVGQKAQEKGIAIVFSGAHEVPRLVIGDPVRLGQILINLVNNAIKFSDKGEIVVQVMAEDVTLDKVRLAFSVCDSGIGMSAEQVSNLFQSFNQADTSFTRRYGGTGLGLAISKQLCELMEGSISVESQLGKGSTFLFSASFGIATEELPLTVREPRDHPLKRSVLVVDDSEIARNMLLMSTIASISGERVEGPAFGLQSAPGYLPLELTGRRVLMVEDNEINRDVASELLSDLGIRVAVAVNGREGVDQVLAEAFDLVLMDIQMPVMDGLTATRLIRSDARFHQLPIIAMTAHTMSGDRERSLEAGMNDHLTKPINPDTLAAMLFRWMPVNPREPELARFRTVPGPGSCPVSR